MKKTVTANIGGLVFHIEEDAYEKLNRYLDSIRTKFNGADESAEIISDIEARIAELFQERHGSDAEKVVTMQHVDEVIAILGQPDDYVDEETATGAGYDKGNHGGRRRLFRDPDDRWVAGVLSGIAAYFNIDALILRIIFILMMFAGFGFLLYIILWIVVPTAETAADKLQMRGEAVTVDNIKRVFEEGKDSLRKGADTVANEAKATYEQFKGSNARRSSGAAVNFIGDTIGLLAKAFVKFIGFILLVVGALIAIAFLAAIFGQIPMVFDDASVGFSTFRELIFTSGLQATLAFLGAALFFIVPAIAMLYAGIRILFNVDGGGKLIATILGPLWFAGIVLMGIVGVQIAADFSNESEVQTDAIIQQPEGGVLYLDVIQDPANSKYVGRKHRGSHNMLSVDEDQVHVGLPHLEIETSTSGKFELILQTEANGRTYKDASSRAAGINARYEQQDSILKVGRSYTFDVEDKFRAQQLTYIVRVPLGKSVHFSRSTKRIIHNVPNTTNTWDQEMIDRTWTMTRSGLSSGALPGQINEPTLEKENDEEDENGEDEEVKEVAMLPSAPTLVNISMPDLLGHFRMTF